MAWKKDKQEETALELMPAKATLDYLMTLGERLVNAVEGNSRHTTIIVEALATFAADSERNRHDAAEWRAAVLKGENDELVDIVEQCLILFRSAGKAINAHHNPVPPEGARDLRCNTCNRFDIGPRAQEIFVRLRERNVRAEARARRAVDLGETETEGPDAADR